MDFPTKPGFYWAKFNINGELSPPQIVEVFENQDTYVRGKLRVRHNITKTFITEQANYSLVDGKPLIEFVAPILSPEELAQLTETLLDGLYIDGGHHKQYALMQIASALQIEFPAEEYYPPEPGIAP